MDSPDIVTFECSECGGELRSKRKDAGKRFRCPTCSEIAVVPSPPEDEREGRKANRPPRRTSPTRDRQSSRERSRKTGRSKLPWVAGGAFAVALIAFVASMVWLVTFIGKKRAEPENTPNVAIADAKPSNSEKSTPPEKPTPPPPPVDPVPKPKENPPTPKEPPPVVKEVVPEKRDDAEKVRAEQEKAATLRYWSYAAGFTGCSLSSVWTDGQKPDAAVLAAVKKSHEQLGLDTELFDRLSRQSFTQKEVEKLLGPDVVATLEKAQGADASNCFVAGNLLARYWIAMEVKERDPKADVRKENVSLVLLIVISSAKKAQLPKDFIDDLESVRRKLDGSWTAAVIRECNGIVRPWNTKLLDVKTAQRYFQLSGAVASLPEAKKPADNPNPKKLALSDLTGKWESDSITLTVDSEGKSFCSSKFRVGASQLVQYTYENKFFYEKDGDFLIDLQKITWAVRAGTSKDTIELRAKDPKAASPNVVTLTKKGAEAIAKNPAKDDTLESLMEQTLEAYGAVNAALAKVKDAKSAAAARPELRELGKRIGDIMAKMDKYGKPTEEQKATPAYRRFAQQFEEIGKKMLDEGPRLAKIPGANGLIGEVLTEAKKKDASSEAKKDPPAAGTGKGYAIAEIRLSNSFKGSEIATSRPGLGEGTSITGAKDEFLIIRIKLNGDAKADELNAFRIINQGKQSMGKLWGYSSDDNRSVTFVFGAEKKSWQSVDKLKLSGLGLESELVAAP